MDSPEFSLPIPLSWPSHYRLSSLPTELTIARNQHLIQSKEGDWTFGQTLALTLTLIPLIEVFKFLWEKCPWAPEESGESTETGEAGWAVEDEETKEARESGEDVRVPYRARTI